MLPFLQLLPSQHLESIYRLGHRKCALKYIWRGLERICITQQATLHSSSCYLLSCFLGLHRFHRLWGLCCCLLGSLLCHVDQDWEIETVGNLRVFKDKLPWTRWTRMSPYYASPGPTVGSTIGGSHKASWEIAVLEITNNPKALNIKKSLIHLRAQRKAFRFRIVDHLSFYVYLCSALIVFLRFRV